jgi:hypothetical protein
MSRVCRPWWFNDTGASTAHCRVRVAAVRPPLSASTTATASRRGEQRIDAFLNNYSRATTSRFPSNPMCPIFSFFYLRSHNPTLAATIQLPTRHPGQPTFRVAAPLATQCPPICSTLLTAPAARSVPNLVLKNPLSLPSTRSDPPFLLRP